MALPLANMVHTCRFDRQTLSTHVRDDKFNVPAQWLVDHQSRLCPGCKVSIVALKGRCDGCKNRTLDSCHDVSAPRARNLPKLVLNHVQQVTLGASETVLSLGLPPPRAKTRRGKEVFEVEKIIDKRRQGKKVEYLVVWKGYSDPSDNSWENLTSLATCKDTINAFERTYIPPPCVKKGDDVCSCGDTGCDGPPAVVYQASSSSWDGVPKETPIPAVSEALPVSSKIEYKLETISAVSKALPVISKIEYKAESIPGVSEALPVISKFEMAEAIPAAVSALLNAEHKIEASMFIPAPLPTLGAVKKTKTPTSSLSTTTRKYQSKSLSTICQPLRVPRKLLMSRSLRL